MSFSLVTAVIVLGVVALVVGLPARIRREVAPPSAMTGVTFEEIKYSGTTLTVDNSPIGACFNVMELNTPTTIKLIAGAQTSYNLKVSTSSCDAEIWSPSNEMAVTQDAPVELNSRNAFCSFKLGKRQLPERPVQVIFYKGNLVGSTNKKQIDNNQECISLCSNSDPNPWLKHASAIEILNSDGVAANNFVTLFSDKDCKTRLQPMDGKTGRVEHRRDLVKMTQVNSNTVKSYKFVGN